MRAAVCRDFGGPLRIEELTLDRLGVGEVRVEIAACAICHSDVHYAQGAWGGDLPAVYGHEAAGIVVEADEAVSGVSVGDRVALSLIRSCGRCARCSRGSEVFCEAGLGPSPYRLRAADGEPVQAGLRCGAFAEEATVHGSQVVRIPEWLGWPAAALLGCGVITGVGAVLNTSSVDAEAVTAVVGVGGVGVNVLQAASLVEAPVIVAVDVVERKLEAARRFGATHTVLAARGASSSAREVRGDLVAQRVRESIGERGVSHAFVTVGSAAAIRSALEMVEPGGEVVIVGMPPNGSPLQIEPSELAERGVRLIGSKMGAARLRPDVERILAWARDGAYDLDGLVSNVYPLAEINTAMAEVSRGDAIRNVVAMRGERDLCSTASR